jgi:histone-lysine N-methyltransferase SETD1
MSLAELAAARQTRGARIALGHSAIQGWGLFACAPLPAHGVVVEYVGEAVRNSVADARERRYQRARVQDYQFRLSPAVVLDATRRGGLARFINHSCAPNSYASVRTSEDGAAHIVILARRRIEAGEEVTYDYQCPEEAEKIPCLCGAPSCRLFLN